MGMKSMKAKRNRVATKRKVQEHKKLAKRQLLRELNRLESCNG